MSARLLLEKLESISAAYASMSIFFSIPLLMRQHYPIQWSELPAQALPQLFFFVFGDTFNNPSSTTIIVSPSLLFQLKPRTRNFASASLYH